MMGFLRQKKAQSTVEYAVLIIIIIAALLSVQSYLKRGVQGKMKSSADDIGEQYSVGNTNMIEATKTSSHTQETFGVSGQGVQETKLLSNEITNTVKRSAIINDMVEDFGKSN